MMSNMIIEIVKDKKGYTFFKHINGRRIHEDECNNRMLFATMERITRYYNNAPDKIDVVFVIGEEKAG